MMGTNKVDNDIWKSLLFGQFNPVGDMTNNNSCTFQVAQFIVGRGGRSLVFCKILRICKFSYIMVKRTGAYKQGVSSNQFGSIFCKVGYLHGVLKGTGSFFR